MKRDIMNDHNEFINILNNTSEQLKILSSIINDEQNIQSGIIKYIEQHNDDITTEFCSTLMNLQYFLYIDPVIDL